MAWAVSKNTRRVVSTAEYSLGVRNFIMMINRTQPTTDNIFIHFIVEERLGTAVTNSDTLANHQIPPSSFVAI
jgi:hypothetical protein